MPAAENVPQRTASTLLTLIDMRLGEAFQLGRMAIAFSGQMEDTLLLWRAANSGRPFAAFTLDTGKLHQETRDYTDTLETTLGFRIHRLTPDPRAVVLLERELGATGIYESVSHRQRCCQTRKVEPLRTFLTGFSGWVTGQRREQSATRLALALREQDAAFSLTKFNPLADFSLNDVRTALDTPGAPAIHPLHHRGYPSIGCDPCTRAIRPGEDLRAGRWWWETRDTKECGLHQTTITTEH
ncbi:MAG: phosphoadenylyl-sulfate reductase [Burkholderiaceae bacterium]|nr:phosphoadenylyl-sulfate reductase [Burkholderiaceae bacterium]